MSRVSRKLQAEIDRTLKKVSDGIDVFDEIWDKVYSAPTQSQKEKYEADLKKEIKKLQRLRDSIKTWISNNDIKDKTELIANRKAIETKMEQFKICEKETKTKAFSKEGLLQPAKVDPEEKKRKEVRDWVRKCLDSLSSQTDAFEAELESLSTVKGVQDKEEQLEESIEKHQFHTQKLEQVLRLFENHKLTVDQVNSIQDSVEQYIEFNQEDDFYPDDEVYDDLLAEVDTDIGSVGTVSVDSPRSDDASSNNSGSSGPKKKPITSASSIKLSDLVNNSPKTKKKDSDASSSSSRSSKTASPSSKSKKKKSESKPPTPVAYAAAAAGLRGDEKESSKKKKKEKKSASAATKKERKKKQQQLQQQQELEQEQKEKETEAQQQKTENIQPSQQNEKQKEESITEESKPSIAQVVGNNTSTTPTEEDSSLDQLNDETFGDVSVNTELSSLEQLATQTTNIQQQDHAEHVKDLETSMKHLPSSVDSERPRHYTPHTQAKTPKSFPTEPAVIFNDPSVFSKFETDTLFFIFYYQQGTYQQYLAARELKKQSWRYHKKYLTWFQRHYHPRIATDDYEQGTYVYFDYETGWCQRIKSGFSFEYKYLEDELPVGQHYQS